MTQRRRRFKQTTSLKERLEAEASSCREQAKLLGPGLLRERLLRKARQAYMAAQLDGWLRSPGLGAPNPTTPSTFRVGQRVVRQSDGSQGSVVDIGRDGLIKVKWDHGGTSYYSRALDEHIRTIGPEARPGPPIQNRR